MCTYLYAEQRDACKCHPYLSGKSVLMIKISGRCPAVRGLLIHLAFLLTTGKEERD